jgi:hypothetical protein
LHTPLAKELSSLAKRSGGDFSQSLLLGKNWVKLRVVVKNSPTLTM